MFKKIFLLIFFFVFLSSTTIAQEYIEKIIIEGNQRVETETINSYISIKTGDVFDQDLLNSSLKNLFSSGFFSDVKLSRKESTLIFTVIENPIVNRVVFEGNGDIDDEELESEIRIKPRSLFTRSKIQIDIDRILELYKRNGSFSAEVKPKVISLPQNRVDIIFEIEEGKDTVVGSITFNGNKEFSDRRLRDIIVTRQTRWYSILSATDKYDPDQISADNSLLRNHYRNNGFADVEVNSGVAQLDKSKSSFNIIFNIKEGKQYRFGNVSIESGIVEIDIDNISSKIKIEEGDIYSANKIEDTVKLITKNITNQGFPFTDTIPEVERVDGTNKISLIFRVNEAPKKYINRINILGNSRTLDSVIRRNMRLSEGDAYVPSLIARSKTLIGNLGFFSSVDVKEVPTDKYSYSDINVSVVEQSTGELSLGGGFSSQVGGLVNVGISERNFLGKAQILNLNAKLSERETNYTAGFSEPFFLDRDVYASINLFNNKHDYKESNYVLKREGFSFATSFNLSEYFNQSVSYSLQERVVEPEVGASASIFAEKGETSISQVSSSLTYNTLDNNQNPSEGLRISGGSSLAGIGGDKKLLNLFNEGDYYKPYNDKLFILNLGYDFGFVTGLGEDVLISDRYFLGGNSFRGFSQSGLGPRDTITGDSLGGNFYYTGSVKGTFGLGLPPELGLRGNMFTTFGTLTGIDKTTVTYNDDSAIRLSAGVGISWTSPFGPISVILSQAILKKDYDKTETVSFGIGTQF
tara:strand:- start:11079 stop:13331 length:2253 start_codon:yes stop_codon:yes gene_type:complete